MPAKANMLSPKCPFTIKSRLWEPSVTTEPMPGPTGMKRNLPIVNREFCSGCFECWIVTGLRKYSVIHRSRAPLSRLPAISHRDIIKVKSLIGELNGKRNRWLFNEYFLVAFLVYRGRRKVLAGGTDRNRNWAGASLFSPVTMYSSVHTEKSGWNLPECTEFFPSDSYSTDCSVIKATQLHHLSSKRKTRSKAAI